MDKTGKIVVTLAVIVLIAWWTHQPAIPPQAGPAASPSPSPAVAGSGQQPDASGSTAPEIVTPAAPVQPEPVLPEQTQQIATSLVDFTFTNHGGGISQAQLNGVLVDQDSNGKDVVLNDYGTVPIGATSDKPGVDATASYTSTLDGANGITYQRTTSQQIEIVKKYTLPTAKDGPDQYIATLDLTITNRGSKPYNSGGYYIYLGSAAPIHKHDQPRYICMDWYLNGKAAEINVMSAFSASRIPLIGYELHAEKAEYTATGDNILWSALYGQFFTTIITPQGGGANSIWSTRSPLDLATHKFGADWVAANPPGATPSLYAINGALGFPGFNLTPGGGSYTKQFKIYVGPRQYQVLSQMGENQVALLHYGWFGFVSRGLLWLMIQVQKVVGSYAVAIILLTIAIKAALWPLQNRSTQSMKKMQALNPKMTELREKYKDDPAKMNQETIKLYKTYGVNPLAGCLPMFIQLPVFFGFYSMLASAFELRNSRFLWVHDLSQPDTAHLLGFSVNILPLCMAATSVWMMSMTPKSGDSSQQKMMMFMPLIFLFICYNYASGLALYFMVSNLCTVVQYYVTKNSTAPAMEKVPVFAKKRR